jgi:cell wall-associated NlpC family hydrolase
MDVPKKGIRGWHGGKGTPSEITQTTKLLAKEQNVDLQKLSSDQIRQFMTKNRLGVDCSGFIYYLLDQTFLQLHHNSLDKIIKAKLTKNPLNPPRFRCNADCLTNDPNTIPIIFPKERIQSGDLIRIHQGKHVAIIIKSNKSKITYAHSSGKTATTGVHFGQINITQLKKDLSQQSWLELTPSGKNYGTLYFRPRKGDGIRRLKNLV